MSNNTESSLQELYIKKKAKIQKLLDITLKECSQKGETDMEGLENFLSLRRKIMDEVDSIDKELKNAADDSVVTIKKEIRELVAQIIKYDEQIKTKLGEEMIGLKQKLKGLHGGKSLKQAYYPRQQQKFGYFIDKKE